MTQERPDPARIMAAFRAASPEGRLETYEVALRDADLRAAAEADGLDLARWQWQVGTARAELGRGHIDSARAHIAAADRDFLAVLHRLDPVRKTGAKQRKVLADHRGTAHANQRERVEARQKAIASLLGETRLTGGVLERHLQEKLLDRFEIEASPRTIRRDVKAIAGRE
jgi:hypothetical protein